MSLSLFSEDGQIDQFASRNQPPHFFLPTERTDEEIEQLFTCINALRVTGSLAAQGIEIAELKQLPFAADLLYLTSAEQHGPTSFTFDHLRNGLLRMVAHFIARSEFVQSRINAYIRFKLASAEIVIDGAVSSQHEQLVERDQILLNCVSLPSTPRAAASEGQSGFTSSRQEISVEAQEQIHELVKSVSAAAVATKPTKLFRSKTTTDIHMTTIPKDLFQFDEETSIAIESFLPDFFRGRDVMEQEDLSPLEFSKLQEIWMLFDFDDDGLVSRSDLYEGLKNIASHFMLLDDVIQLVANSYIQRKIRRAVYAIQSHEIDSSAPVAASSAGDDSPPSAATSAATSSSSLDVGGNSSKADTSPAASPLRTTLTEYRPGSQVVFTDQEGNRHVAVVIRKSQRLLEKFPAYYVETKGIKLYVSSRRLEVLSSEDAVKNGPVEFLGEDGVDKRFEQSMLDTPSKEYKLLFQLSRHSEVNDGIDDADTANDIDTSDPQTDVEGPDPPEKLQNFAQMSPVRSSISIAAVEAVNESLAREVLSQDAVIFEAVGTKIGKSYPLEEKFVPLPKRVSPYPIYFNRGKNGFFEFNQIDYGIHFLPFFISLQNQFDKATINKYKDSIEEGNRCFFLHLGVAMSLHPYALQHCFRCAAKELLAEPDNIVTVFFGEALESLLIRNDFVDAQVLSAIWPVEFDEYKILFVRVDNHGRIESFTTFRSENGPVDEFGEWNGKEVIFTLQWNHFTILKPTSEQLNRPITAVLAAAGMIGIMPLEFIVNIPEKRYRVSSPC